MLAIVAPGQGAQTPGFLTPWLKDPVVATHLDELSEAVELDLKGFGTDADADTIRDTAIAQPLLVAAGLVAARALFPAQSSALGGAGMVAGLAEADVTLTAGSSKTTTLVIPAGAMVIGASARVKQAITGSLASWSLGTAGALDRFGSGLGLGTGSYARGILGTPTTYWTAAPLIVTAVGGTFSGGQLRLAVHWWELRLPD